LRPGVSVVTLDDEKEYTAAMLDDPLTFITVVLSFMRAHDESQQKSRRVKAAWSNRKDKAVKHGFLIAESAPHWVKTIGGLGDPDRRFELIPERAAVVARVVDLYLSGLGPHAIADRLNSEGAPCFRNGRQWWDEGVRRVLDSPSVGGILMHGSEMRYGYFPAAVTAERWELVRDLRIKRTSPRQHGGTAIANPLAGLGKCGICGGTLSRVFKGSWPRKMGLPKLVCSWRGNGLAKCDHPYFSIDLTSAMVALTNALPQILAEAPSGNAEIDAEVDRLRGELEGIGDQLGRLMDPLRQHGRSEAISEALTALEGHRKATEAQLRTAEQRALAVSPRAAELRRAELFDLLGREHTTGELNVALRAVFDRVDVDPRTGLAALKWVSGEDGPSVRLAMPAGTVVERTTTTGTQFVAAEAD
jgi:Recombinase